jgi:hypothetical protein
MVERAHQARAQKERKKERKEKKRERERERERERKCSRNGMRIFVKTLSAGSSGEDGKCRAFP